MTPDLDPPAAASLPRLVFFDLDGTISHRDTLLPYVARYLLHHPWRLWRLAGVLPPLLGLVTGRADRGALKGELIHAVLGGITAAEVEAWNARSLPHLLERGLFSAARAAIDAHRRHGDHLVLMSASVDLYVPELGRQLGFDATICSGVLWHAGRLDGRLSTANCRDEEKARQFRRISAAHPGLQTVAYANAASDLPHMLLATHAILVNPSPQLRQRAAGLGIESVEWRNP